MQAELTKEHKWLEQLLGEWTADSECRLDPEQPPMHTKGTVSIRSLGGAWIISEGTAEMPDGGTGRNIMTLGFNPKQNAFVGTFIADCMTHLWPYKGTLNAEETILTLDSEGPGFSGDDAKYQDIIEIVSKDHWILRSQYLDPEGKWVPFNKSDYHRVK